MNQEQSERSFEYVTDIEDALTEHANSLFESVDLSDKLLKSYPQVSGVLSGLFRIAKRVGDALVPIDPADTFVVELKDRLLQMAGEQAERITRLRQKRMLALQIAGVVSLMVSGVAMIALAVRFIIALVSRRRATTAA